MSGSCDPFADHMPRTVTRPPIPLDKPTLRQFANKWHITKWKRCPRCPSEQPVRTGNARYCDDFGGRWKFELACPTCGAIWETRSQHAMNLPGANVMRDVTGGEHEMKVYTL